MMVPPGLPRSTGRTATSIVLSIALVSCVEVPEGDFSPYQDRSPPTLSVHAKADHYETEFESFRTPAGTLHYRRLLDEPPGTTWGAHSDVAFHTGIALGAAALRWSASRDLPEAPDALHACERAIAGLELLHAATGVRGLLARHAIPRSDPALPTDDGEWHESPLDGFQYRGDVSKDQYAGAIFGIGAAIALLDEGPLRRRAGELAAAIADHLIANDLRIVDADGEETRHGDLRGRIYGVKIGVNALIALACARSAAVATGSPEHRALWTRLVREEYLEITHWAHFALFGVGNRVNDHMAALAMAALLLLEESKSTYALLAASSARSWRHVGGDRNPFFAFVHALALSRRGDHDKAHEVARLGALWLEEFPDDKILWPVDLRDTDRPRRWLPSRRGLPRARDAIPLWLRPRLSSLWVSDPFALVGTLGPGGLSVSVGTDYLVAYWLGRHGGWIPAP